jgi:hypothetical protein
MQEAHVCQLIDGPLGRPRADAQAIGQGALRRPAPAVRIGQAKHQQQHAQRGAAERVEHSAIDQVIRQLCEAAPRGR